MKKPLLLLALAIGLAASLSAETMVFTVRTGTAANSTAERLVPLTAGTFLRVSGSGTIMVETGTAFRTSLGLGTAAVVDVGTGTANVPLVSQLTKGMVGLGNADNTSDLNKPISTAAQTALDGKVNVAGGTASGLSINGSGTTHAGSRVIHVSKASQSTDTRSGLNAYDPTKPFSTLSAALSAASVPDTVLVHSGTYAGAVTSSGNINFVFLPGAQLTSTDATVMSFGGTGNYSITGSGEFAVSGSAPAVNAIIVNNAGAATFECESIRHDGTDEDLHSALYWGSSGTTNVSVRKSIISASSCGLDADGTGYLNLTCPYIRGGGTGNQPAIYFSGFPSTRIINVDVIIGYKGIIWDASGGDCYVNATEIHGVMMGVDCNVEDPDGRLTINGAKISNENSSFSAVHMATADSNLTLKNCVIDSAGTYSIGGEGGTVTLIGVKVNKPIDPAVTVVGTYYNESGVLVTSGSGFTASGGPITAPTFLQGGLPLSTTSGGGVVTFFSTTNPGAGAVTNAVQIYAGTGTNAVKILHMGDSGSSHAMWDVGLGQGADPSDHGTAVGGYAEASGGYCVAIGTGGGTLSTTEASGGQGNVAVGREAKAIGVASVALGSFSQAIGADENVAIGSQTIADGLGNIAVGSGALADSEESGIAIGSASVSSGTRSIAIGAEAIASATGAVQIGTGTNSTPNTIRFQGREVVTSGTDGITSASATGTTANSVANISTLDPMYGRTYRIQLASDLSVSGTTPQLSTETLVLPAGSYQVWSSLYAVATGTTSGVQGEVITTSGTFANLQGFISRAQASAQDAQTLALNPDYLRILATSGTLCGTCLADAPNRTAGGEQNCTMVLSTTGTIRLKVFQRTAADGLNAAILRAGSQAIFRRLP